MAKQNKKPAPKPPEIPPLPPVHPEIAQLQEVFDGAVAAANARLKEAAAVQKLKEVSKGSLLDQDDDVLKAAIEAAESAKVLAVDVEEGKKRLADSLEVTRPIPFNAALTRPIPCDPVQSRANAALAHPIPHHPF